jgi:hypothetical protein
MAKQYIIYQQALDQVRIAAEALDQAHSMLKDVKLDKHVDSGPGSLRLSIQHLSRYTSGLLEDMQITDCPDCEHPILLRHTGEEGCDSETMDGICLCRWGSLEVGLPQIVEPTRGGVVHTFPKGAA